MDIRLDYSGSTLGKYKLIEKLGNGGFGAVYKAIDGVLNVEKAIKILEVSDPTKAYELFNEAAIPYECRHNNIVKINGGELIPLRSEVLFVIDMELVNGVSIENLLKTCFIPVCDTIRYIKDILFALEFSHLKGIIHRDIKPANILLDNGVPKLSDFGLSTALGNLIIPWKWYRTHAAPETFSGKSVATIETDIFAVGMTLFRMVNNISDWQGYLQNIPNYEKLIKNGKLIEKMHSFMYVPTKIHKIIKKACHVDPQKRYHSAAEMRNALEKIHLSYNWNKKETDFWEGLCPGFPDKTIFLEKKRKSIGVVVTSNGRRISKECRQFTDQFEAEKYMLNYIATTSIQ